MNQSVEQGSKSQWTDSKKRTDQKPTECRGCDPRRISVIELDLLGMCKPSFEYLDIVYTCPCMNCLVKMMCKDTCMALVRYCGTYLVKLQHDKYKKGTAYGFRLIQEETVKEQKL